MQAPFKIHKLLLRTNFGYMGFLFQNNEEVYEFNQFLQYEPKEVYKVQPENKDNKYSVSLEPGQSRLVIIKIEQSQEHLELEP